MRILFVQPMCDRRGHYGLYTINLCQALSNVGHTVTLCTNKAYPERYLEHEPTFTIAEVHDGRLGFERYDSGPAKFARQRHWGYVRNSFIIFKAALRLASEGGVDVIHVTGVEFLTGALVLKLFHYRKMPPVVMEISAANFAYSSYPGSPVMRLYKVLQREVFRLTLGKEIKGIAVLGHWHEQELKKQLRAKGAVAFAVIPDGGRHPREQLAQGVARKAIHVPETSDPVFLYFGLLRRDKGIDTLLKAVSVIAREKFQLVIAGAPVDYSREELYSFVKQLGVDEKVVLRLDYISEDDVKKYFFACDALILPYPKIYTGGSGPLMKGACIHRRPSIVTDVAEMGRLVREYGIGLVAKPEDPGDLARRIKEFIGLTDSAKRQMGERALALATEHTWDKMALRYTDLYQKALQ